MIDIQRANDAILRAITMYEKQKQKAQVEWSKPIAVDMLAMLLAGVKKDTMRMLEEPEEIQEGGQYG